MSGGSLLAPEPGRRRPRWPWISLLPVGLGAWAPIYAGVRAGRPRWIAFGALWSAITIAGFIVAAPHKHSDTAGALLVIGWVGAIATSFTVRSAYERATGEGLDRALAEARERLRERARAQRIAREQPALALEMGIGRPDVPGAQAAGVVDVNNAPAATLATLPEVSAALAERIATSCRELNGFSSLADLGAALDLDPNVVEALGDRTVFLPRRT
ncbi:MAG TPA: helix-hairpin-helix domain-containing protein [Solirubrobacteraceae bacterium]|nr:helix-hairpin-helix domain-containing protein [Solirubrobacteraceae bacterium]